MDPGYKLKWRKVFGRITYGASLIALGAWLALKWMDWLYPGTGKNLHDLAEALPFVAVGLSVLADTIDPNRHQGPQGRDPGPNWIGTLVVALCGVALAYAFWSGRMFGTPDPIAGLVTVALTVFTCVAVWRFASANALKIGEARFKTTRR